MGILRLEGFLGFEPRGMRQWAGTFVKPPCAMFAIYRGIHLTTGEESRKGDWQSNAGYDSFSGQEHPYVLSFIPFDRRGVAQYRYCATSLEVPGSIPCRALGNFQVI
jgi:hypothetical protein